MQGSYMSRLLSPVFLMIALITMFMGFVAVVTFTTETPMSAAVEQVSAVFLSEPERAVTAAFLIASIVTMSVIAGTRIKNIRLQVLGFRRLAGDLFAGRARRSLTFG